MRQKLVDCAECCACFERESLAWCLECGDAAALCLKHRALHLTATPTHCRFAEQGQEGYEFVAAAAAAMTPQPKKEKMVCKHTDAEVTPFEIGDGCCSECGSQANVWACLVCGNRGCGRRQFDGSGGNGHALAHVTASGHQVAAKLGTRPAEIFCYACDDFVGQQLAGSLSFLSSTGNSLQPSTADLELSMASQLAAATAEGQVIQPRPGCLGIANSGNFCYVSALLQVLARVPDLLQLQANGHFSACKRLSNCVECAFGKVAAGLLFKAVEGTEGPVATTALNCRFLQRLLPFAAGQQQDVHELFDWAFDRLANADRLFGFTLAERLCCLACGCFEVQARRERYLLLTFPQDGNASCSLAQLLDAFFAPATVVRSCGLCGAAEAQRQLRLLAADAPQQLLLTVQHFTGAGGKAAVSVLADGQELSLAKHTAAWETAPSDWRLSTADDADEEMLGLLLSLGFAADDCKQALAAALGAAMPLDWYCGLLSAAKQPSSYSVAAGKELLSYSLTSVISHRGTATSFGHYVADCWDSSLDAWLRFDDAVVTQLQPVDAIRVQKEGYLYFFQQINNCT